MDLKILKYEKHDQVFLVTINRPEVMNALNSRFFDEMEFLLNKIRQENEDLRALVITGTGKAFVAGADISEMKEKTQEEGSAFSRRGQAVFRMLEEFPVPVIAAINGYALGGGLELAMACDFRFASEKAKFGQPEVNLGLIPGYAGTQRLSRLCGLGNALYLLTTAEMIDAETALRMNLIQKILPVDSLLEESLKTARLIASKGPKSVQQVKIVTRRGLGMNFMEGSALESKEFGKLFGKGNQGYEGMGAFLEKRKPEW
jgi:enoyl-CoA hydratase